MPLGETIYTSWKHQKSQKEITLPLELTGSIFIISLRWHKIQRKHMVQSVLWVKQARLCWLVSRKGNSQVHHYLSSGTPGCKQRGTTLPRALHRHSPSQDFSAQVGLVEPNEFDHLLCMYSGWKKIKTKQTPHPRQALSRIHSTMPQLPMLKRELPPSEILHRLLHAPGRVRENGTERCSTEVLHIGYLQYMAHLRAKIQQGRSQTAALPLYAIDTYLMTTNAWILCNESKTTCICGREDSLSRLIQLWQKPVKAGEFWNKVVVNSCALTLIQIQNKRKGNIKHFSLLCND